MGRHLRGIIALSPAESHPLIHVASQAFYSPLVPGEEALGARPARSHSVRWACTPTEQASALNDRTSLHALLELEQLDSLLFRGRSRSGTPVRMFGGEVAGQALVAAGRTVPTERRVHSLHAYFLRPGDPAIPLVYRVESVRDGRSFTTRRVVAIQRGEAVFTLAASFHRDENGLQHQVAEFDAPPPEGVPVGVSGEQSVEGEADWWSALRDRFPLDVRFPEAAPAITVPGTPRSDPRQRMWVRSTDPLGDDPLVHACAATYVSDLFLLSAALPPHSAAIGDSLVQLASLDHAVWFHAPFRADRWLLYEQEGFRAGSGRALVRGTLFDEAGVHVATVMQEGLLRLPPADSDGDSAIRCDRTAH